MSATLSKRANKPFSTIGDNSITVSFLFNNISYVAGRRQHHPIVVFCEYMLSSFGLRVSLVSLRNEAIWVDIDRSHVRWSAWRQSSTSCLTLTYDDSLRQQENFVICGNLWLTILLDQWLTRSLFVPSDWKQCIFKIKVTITTTSCFCKVAKTTYSFIDLTCQYRNMHIQKRIENLH